MPEEPVYSDADIARIAAEVGGIKPQQEQEIQGATFDLNDEEIVRVTDLWMKLQEKWRGRPFDLRSQMYFKDEARTAFYDIGFVVDIGWIERTLPDGRPLMIPDIVFKDRVGGLQVYTDHERKQWDAQHRTLDDLPVPEVAKTLLD